MEATVGRILLGLLFVAGAVQKSVDAAPVIDLLAGAGLPGWLVWPALLFNGLAGVLLIANRHVRTVARALAAYCMVTSIFHWVPEDGWQMSIFVKNWAIAGGLLVLSGRSARHCTAPAKPGASDQPVHSPTS